MNEPGFINGIKLKKGDRITYQIKQLGGVKYNPPVLHTGTIVTPVFNRNPYWVAQIIPDNLNPALPNWELNAGVQAIYGDLIVDII